MGHPTFGVSLGHCGYRGRWLGWLGYGADSSCRVGRTGDGFWQSTERAGSEGAGSLYELRISGWVADCGERSAGSGGEIKVGADGDGDAQHRSGGGGAGDVRVSDDGFLRECEGGAAAGG